ncbi:nucleosidase [Actinoplanes sp. N902-109]|uniref:nucleosidase n=1 Tax=Actinoplanes sp. (strain N902-109) TaxID=649831 RepID=UPI0003293A22|nr:nucleosidase [Actinoplanes sp. N902-109]AGL17306.1 5-methylthioadenosine nucleosidase or S-adenosylhomocysteine nucleosidase [Actinoplanes sp. N902-109]
MRIIGAITPDKPLLVMAVALEAEALGSELPVLLTGMGKVNAALSVAAALAGGSRPREIINLGTAGALRPGMSGTHTIGTVLQHDLDSETLLKLTGEVTGPPLPLGDPGGVVLATGDAFVADPATRDRLAQHAHLVDMEGYAVAAAAHAARVPVRLVKHVSDDAGQHAAATWRESVAECSRHLAGWLAVHAAG